MKLRPPNNLIEAMFVVAMISILATGVILLCVDIPSATGKARCFAAGSMQDNGNTTLFDGRFNKIRYYSDGNEIRITDEQGKRIHLINAQCIVEHDE